MTERSIIHVGGSPGSGKTRLGKAMAERLTADTDLRAEHISLGNRVRMIGRGVLWSAYQQEIREHLNDPRTIDMPLDGEIVRRVIADALSQSDANGTDVVLLDGYPRYIDQVETYFELAQISGRQTPGGLIATVGRETALARMLKRGRDHQDRAIDVDEAVKKLDLHDESYPLTLHQLGMYALRFDLWPIDTSGPYERTGELGFQATMRLLGRPLPHAA